MGLQARRAILFFSFFCLTRVSVAQTNSGQPEEIHPEDVVVKVLNVEASPFTGQKTGGSHGTAFVVNIDEDGTATLFTNRHVVQTQAAFKAQHLQIAVSNGAIPEKADATVDFISTLFDFAVIKVKIKDLPLTGRRLKALPLPPPGSVLYEFPANIRQLKARMAVAIGNPYDSSQIVTEGKVTGINTQLTEAPWLQIQVPINPGNSGGPLIDAQTGIVLGINSAGIRNSQNVGYALPIRYAMEDYARFLSDNDYAVGKQSPFGLDLVSLDELASLGLLPLLEKQYPNLKTETEALVRIKAAKASTNPAAFQVGDIILEINGEKIGSALYKIFQAVQIYAESDVTVLRGDKIITLKQEYPIHKLKRLREKADFVIVSGLLFYQQSPTAAWISSPSEESQVRLASPVLPDSEIAFSAAEVPNMESIVVGVALGTKYYPIKKLLDFKLALRANPDVKAMRLDVRQALWGKDPEGNPVLMRYPTMQPMFLPSVTMHTLPVTDVKTPADFSLRRFVGQFSFKPEARDARNFKLWTETPRSEQAQARRASQDSCLKALSPGETVTAEN